MQKIALIPARGGSKRLPGKNLKPLGGLPLLVHSIRYAQDQLNIDAVAVSTEDAAIAGVARQYGAIVVERPSSLADDMTPTRDVLQHALTVLPKTITDVVVLQPTNPLRPKDLFVQAWQTYQNGGYDSLMTVNRHYQKLGTLSHHKFMPYNYEFGQRSQDIEPLYYENGLLYIAKAHLIGNGQLLGSNHYAYIVEHPFATVDIDDAQDFAYASFMIQEYGLEG